MTLHRTIASLVVSVVACIAVADDSLATSVCKPGETLNADQVQERIKERAKEVYFEVYSGEPLTAPPSNQTTAPSGVSTSTSLVDGADFSSIVALALDQDLVETSKSAVTLNLSPFAFVTAADPGIIDDQRRYEEPAYRWMRQWGATVSIGGKGKEFDRDGDGEVDPALEAKKTDDIITWEVRYRIRNRDRREAKNYSRFFEKLGKAFEADDAAWRTFLPKISNKLVGASDNSGNIGCAALERILAAPEHREALIEIARSDNAVAEAAAEDLKEIDRRFILTLVAGGVDRKEDFGPRGPMYALRGSWKSHTFNLEYSKEDGLMGAQDPETWKLSYELSALWWKGRRLGGKDGVEASIAGSYEMFDNVPDANHDTNSKVALKLEFSIGEGVKVPLSLTWVNHKDLLSDEDEVVGHFGLSIDASGLLKKKGS